MKNTVWGAMILVICASIFTSCSPALSITVAADSSGKATFTAGTSAAADAIVRRFTGADSGKTSDGPVFDRKKITISLAHAGLKADSVETPSRSSVVIGVSFAKIDGILAKAVTFDPSGRRISVRLTNDILREALTLMPPDTDRYTDLLMAPVFTGETMNATEYEETIAAAYGKTLAGDLSKSVFTLTIHCPATVRKTVATAPAKAEATGSVAVFRIPLSSLLAPSETFGAAAEW
jgi:hypothetical protein